ncbi:MAG: sensor histidine kinase [Lawsonibacter sp.]|jgi:two-component system sensor histidine kinase KdpD
MLFNPLIRLYHWYLRVTRFLPPLPRNLFTTLLFLSAAYFTSDALIGHTGAENNSALVFVLSVMFISLLTEGYFYGLIASLVGAFCINYFFMFPYRAFSLSYSGYPVAMISMTLISGVVCALTSRIKLQAMEAMKRERDTKALYELNAKLNEEKSAIQLEAARETIRGNILRAVSHDLRTPLTAISGAASVLLSSEEIAQSEKNLSLVQDIKSDADALIAMVENLLSITKIRDGTMPLNKQEEMLEEVAGDALITIRRRFPDFPIALNLSEDILYLPMEPMLIKQVIVNLLENAIRHSGDQEHIQLHLFRQEDWAVVEVRDRGRGISPEVSRAVQSGRQLTDNLSGDSSRGMGIGLSVCQSIIKAHNGFFAAGNDPGGGAVFRFGLPMEEIKDE